MARILRFLWVAALVWLGLAGLAATPSLAKGKAHKSLLSNDLCASIIARAERRHGIPARLLRAISLAETGRVDPRSKAMIAWPWAVNAGGTGHYHATKTKAIAAVKRLRAKGARNIDVGCMQVNLMHHPKAFPNLQTAFDPRQNVAYAAKFLKDLHAKTGSWIDAVAAYHSSVAHQGTPYMLRVLRIWVDRRARPRTTAVAARSNGRAGAIGRTQRARAKAKSRNASPRGASLVRRASARSPAAVKRRWAEVVARRKRFADWLAQRQSKRRIEQQGDLQAGHTNTAGNPG
jgi:hypothetical protein